MSDYVLAGRRWAASRRLKHKLLDNQWLDDDGFSILAFSDGAHTSVDCGGSRLRHLVGVDSPGQKAATLHEREEAPEPADFFEKRLETRPAL